MVIIIFLILKLGLIWKKEDEIFLKDVELYQQHSQMHTYTLYAHAHKSISRCVDIYTETHTLCGKYVLYSNINFLMEILSYYYRTEIDIALVGIFLARK